MRNAHNIVVIKPKDDGTGRIIWVVTKCGLAGSYRHCRETYCLYLQQPGGGGLGIPPPLQAKAGKYLMRR
jgi:hypothetical protein